MALLASLASLAFDLQAVPQFKNLFEAKYGFKTSCSLCHLDESWRINHYGREFVGLGTDGKAMDFLESVDVDRDGYPTKKEIEAGSNPGDPASAPENPGHWLERITPVKPPLKDLIQAFPAALSFLTMERILTQEEIVRLKRSKAVFDFNDADRHAVVFAAKTKEGIAGGAAFTAITEKNSRGAVLHVFLTVADSNGVILEVRPVKVRRLDMQSKEFFRGFLNVRPDKISAIKLPKTIDAKFAKIILSQFAKSAGQIDIVIGP